MTQRERVIEHLKAMSEEKFHQEFQCQYDSMDALFDCPFWVRSGAGGYCKNEDVCHKIPFLYPPKQEAKPTYHVEPKPEQEQGALFS